MAKYLARSGFEIDMSTMDLSDVVRGNGNVVNEHTLKISHGGGYATTLKGDFDLNKQGDVVGGTLTRIQFEDDDHYGTTLSGINISLSSFLRAAQSKSNSDDAAIFSKMLAKDDTISGDINDDVMKGFAGDDKLDGDFGDDTLDGGAGNDTLKGGFDSDVLTGGVGADVFVYENVLDSDEQGSDTITDFSQVEGDKISLRDVGFFDFDTEIRITHTSSQTIVEVDTMGGFNFPLFIRLDGNISLTEADFLL